MTPPAAKHPLHPNRCWTCKNKECPFYDQRSYHSISSEERDTGIRVSEMTPAEFTEQMGCPSHSTAPDQRIAEATIKQQFEPWELLDMICWADLVLHVQFDKPREDVGFCKGESCNYCGKFNKQPEDALLKVVQ